MIAVEIHSAPNRGAAKDVGNSSSAASFAASLKELLSWDWQGAKLVVEHCDAYTQDHTPQKGFLGLDEEIEAVNIANSGGDRTRIGVCINWARSVIETRNTQTAYQVAIFF